jgi:Integrase core domain
VVPTLAFERLFAFLVLGHGRRQLLWFAVTRHPTAEWLAQQIVEAFPWNAAPAYLVRDNDGAYGHAFTCRLRTMGIRDRPISPRSPWQNAYAERLIGTLRRDCLDHVLIFGERHLRRTLTLLPPITMRHARTYRWRRMRRCDERSKPAGLLPLRPFCPGCTINTRGYDFREGQGRGSRPAACSERCSVGMRASPILGLRLPPGAAPVARRSRRRLRSHALMRLKPGFPG